jgi:hypothetical protein
MFLPPKGWLYGRVISTTATIGGSPSDNVPGFENCILIYIYSDLSRTKTPIPSTLHRNHLLVPPIATNERPWTMGFFETVDWRPLVDADVLPVHCFRTFSFKTPPKYYDDKGNELSERSEPCGHYGLDSFQTIDDAVSKALGIPQSKE